MRPMKATAAITYNCSAQGKFSATKKPPKPAMRPQI